MLQLMKDHNQLPSGKFGFRKRKSIIDAIVSLVEMIIEKLEGRNNILCIFLGLSKAFDPAEHLTTLERLGIRAPSLVFDVEKYTFSQNVLQSPQKNYSRTNLIMETRGKTFGESLADLIHRFELSWFQYHPVPRLEKIRACYRFNDQVRCLTTILKKSHTLSPYERRSTTTDSAREILFNHLTSNIHVDYVCSELAAGALFFEVSSPTLPSQVLRTAHDSLNYPHLS